MPRGKGEGSVFRQTDGYWCARVELPRIDGKRRQKKVRAKTKAEVLRKLAALQTQLVAHGDLHTDSLTVTQWFDHWTREAAKTRRPKTMGSYRSMIDNWILPTIGHTRLEKVSPATIRRVFAAMEAAGKSSTYMRNAHTVMSAAFKDAMREGRIPRNPAELVTPPRKTHTELDALTADEAINILAAWADKPEAAMWATFLLTGARRGEVIGLEWDRVGDDLDLSWQLQRLDDRPRPADFEYRVAYGGLYWTRPKTSKGWRIIPLVDPLRSILAAWKAHAPENPWGLVFTRETTTGRVPWDPDAASHAWVRAREESGVSKDVRLHDLRHTTAALLYAAGVPEDVIEAILGHSTAAMSRHYRGRVDRARLEAAMLQLSASVASRG